MLPPSTSAPAVKMIALLSFVFSLSVMVTVVATVAVSAVPVTSPVISPTKAVEVMLVAPVDGSVKENCGTGGWLYVDCSP